jgi:hypothetical protein
LRRLVDENGNRKPPSDPRVPHLNPADGSRGGRKHSKAEQSKAVKRVYKIAKSSRRTTRVYLYEWEKKWATA